MKALLVPREKERRGIVRLPDDYSQYIPDFAWEWLSKYSIDRLETQAYRIGFSEKKESLIFPVFIDTELVMFQTRYFGSNEKEPKYRTYGYKNDVVFIPKEHPDHDVVVLVEDFISAIKVARVTNSVPIFGSGVSQEVMYRLAKMFKRARIWLDPNMKEKSVKTALMMSKMGLSTTTIFSDRDPKEYVTADIRIIVDPKGDRE